jgi:hypothetical protein
LVVKYNRYFFIGEGMEKKTIYVYKQDQSYKPNKEYRVVTFINGNKNIIQIIKELIKTKIT